MHQNMYFLENIISFIDMLRGAGIPVSSEQSIDCCRALALVNIGDRDQVYYAARGTLITRVEHMRLFNVLFTRFWRKHTASDEIGHGQQAPLAPRHERRPHRPLLISYMARKAQENDPEIDVMDKSGTYSEIEILQRKDFSSMTDEELQTVKNLMQSLRWKASLRETRRYVSDNKGQQLHMRRVISSAVKHGGIPIQLTWQKRKIKQRPIVLLADISGSMEKYSRLALQFFYCMSHSLKDVECFVFGTRLTRITGAFRLKNIDRALTETGHGVIDWSGGTRIGDSLQRFNQQWSRRILGRGAIVLVVSDGWERGDVSVLKKEMRYLQLRCHRLIWLNPLLGKTTYKPLVEGMATALRYVDDFLPIHNLQSLEALSKRLTDLDTIRRYNIRN
jgi:uncharacterized protein with von Willebrand factor type A (vWA) domain